MPRLTWDKKSEFKFKTKNIDEPADWEQMDTFTKGGRPFGRPADSPTMSDIWFGLLIAFTFTMAFIAIGLAIAIILE